jgi:hypothetical protein
MRSALFKYLQFSIFLITFSSIIQWTAIPLGNTLLWWIIYSSILFVIMQTKIFFYDYVNDENIKFIKIYLAWAGISIVRGMFVADNYWEWKQLVGSALFLFLPISVYVSTNKMFAQGIISLWLKFALPAFIFIFPIMWGEAYGKYLMPVSFLLLFFPILKTKWKVILLIYSSFVFFGDIQARSNIIKFIIPLLFSLLLFIKYKLNRKILNTIRIAFLAAPFFFFILGASNIYNIFNLEKSIGEITTEQLIEGQKYEVNLTIDSRTFLYKEVINSAIENNYIIWGRTPARGNDSETFGFEINKAHNLGKNERYDNEVSVLNLFTWLGLIGVFLYFLIFVKATYLAIHKSNNIYIKIIGLYVSFRWTYAWVEDFTRFDLTNFFLWLMISMCISESFRKMDNKEFYNWIQGIFDIKYRLMDYLKTDNKEKWKEINK